MITLTEKQLSQGFRLVQRTEGWEKVGCCLCRAAKYYRRSVVGSG